MRYDNILSYRCDDLLLEHAISTEEQAYTFSAFVKETALELGFDSFKSRLISLGVSEISINAIRYAEGAVVSVRRTKNNKGLSICVKDSGPGISDINLAMSSGHSTHNSLGLGLGAAKRAVDEMHIESDASGTIISLTSYLPIAADDIDVGAVSFAKVGEYYKRDGYCIKPYQGECILIGLFDCHEDEDNVEAALLLVNDHLNDNHRLPLKVLIEQSHKLLQEHHFTKGMEMGLLRITPDNIESIIVGNITIKSLLPLSTGIFNQLPGSLGISLPKKLATTELVTPTKYCLILHSDGITHSELPQYKALELCANKHAEEVFDTYAIDNDDATVLVLKSNG